ncbi:MAG: pilus assembly protein TadG-related protein, partial [Terracidiphilus sp.]
MRMRRASVLLRLAREESGQSMAILGFGVFVLLGLAGISIEIGHGYYALELLQASTGSAALAAAQGLPDASKAQTDATTYSAEALQWNRNNIMQVTSLTVTPYCSATIANPPASLGYGVPCQPLAIGDPAYNAVTVTQKAQFNTWFGNIGPIHAPIFHLTATATAAMAGGNLTPYNIAIVLDTTGTMGLTDTSGDCGTGTFTAEQCALQGVQALLQSANPCATLQNCLSGSATPVDAVSLFVFPMRTGATAYLDSDCSALSSKPSTYPYTVPTHPAGTFSSSGILNGGDGYQILSFADGLTYKATDLSNTLNTGDHLVNAAGDGCPGIKTPGGRGTYLPQLIYEAGVALRQAQAARPGSNNALIILSDGNMDAAMNYTWTNSGSCTGTITGLASPTAA